VRLAITTLERLALAPNYLVSLPPSPFDPGPRAERGNGPRVRYGRANPPSRVGVLIGGNSGSLRFDREDWQQLMGFLREAHRAHGVNWLAATSRRSGSFIGDALATMAAEADSGLETFIDYRTAGPGTLPRIFAAAEVILCTDDSTMMISEAVGACLPVVSVVPAAAGVEAREAEFRQALAAKGWYRPLLLSRLTPEAFLAALEEIEPRTSNQLDELAAAVSQRLPELFARP
jgi:mitochondrial fission protein ELM1